MLAACPAPQAATEPELPQDRLRGEVVQGKQAALPRAISSLPPLDMPEEEDLPEWARPVMTSGDAQLLAGWHGTSEGLASGQPE